MIRLLLLLLPLIASGQDSGEYKLSVDSWGQLTCRMEPAKYTFRFFYETREFKFFCENVPVAATNSTKALWLIGQASLSEDPKAFSLTGDSLQKAANADRELTSAEKLNLARNLCVEVGYTTANGRQLGGRACAKVFLHLEREPDPQPEAEVIRISEPPPCTGVTVTRLQSGDVSIVSLVKDKFYLVTQPKGSGGQASEGLLDSNLNRQVLFLGPRQQDLFLQPHNRETKKPDGEVCRVRMY